MFYYVKLEKYMKSRGFPFHRNRKFQEFMEPVVSTLNRPLALIKLDWNAYTKNMIFGYKRTYAGALTADEDSFSCKFGKVIWKLLRSAICD